MSRKPCNSKIRSEEHTVVGRKKELGNPKPDFEPTRLCMVGVPSFANPMGWCQEGDDDNDDQNDDTEQYDDHNDEDDGDKSDEDGGGDQTQKKRTHVQSMTRARNYA